ncbi:MAG: hypothetical protein L0312_15700, partial [Acidobacteria bacterium]|nr:hypothetical protein [Acidobacteriota bacterium]
MDWIPAISTSALLALALWLTRNLVLTRLTKSVQHEFDAKLETLRAVLRKNEEEFKAELRRKDDEITAIRTAAMTALASSQAEVERRRIQAVDQLWNGVKVLSSGKWAASVLSTLKIDIVSAHIENDPKLQQVIGVMALNIDEIPKLWTGSEAHAARPYVSPMAWALFSAYQAIMGFAVSLLAMLKQGLPAEKFFDQKGIANILKAALPEHGEYIDRYGSAGYFYLLDQL